MSKFTKLFDKSRFSAVFRFYAAITKLKTPGIEDVIIRIARKKQHSLVLSLLHCLYEAQDLSLCESVAQQLQHGLDLKGTTLTPSDCLCIGYFLAHVFKMAAGTFKVNLGNCSIHNQGCKYLVNGLHKFLDTDSAVTTLLQMDIRSNAVSHHRVQHLSTLLKLGCINHLELTFNNLLPKQLDTTHAPFVAFTEQLTNNTTLRTLWLQKCGITS